jgi:hypothetical protein
MAEALPNHCPTQLSGFALFRVQELQLWMTAFLYQLHSHDLLIKTCDIHE